jgi:hypothetical protein
MKENKRLYPISEELFNWKVLPVIEGNYIWKGRPPKVSHYTAFCGILYILRTGCPWRELEGNNNRYEKSDMNFPGFILAAFHISLLTVSGIFVHKNPLPFPVLG